MVTFHHFLHLSYIIQSVASKRLVSYNHSTNVSNIRVFLSVVSFGEINHEASFFEELN